MQKEVLVAIENEIAAIRDGNEHDQSLGRTSAAKGPVNDHAISTRNGWSS